MNVVSWPSLATYAGSLTMVLAITQFMKSFSFMSKIPTQFLSLILALALLIPANYFTLNLTAASFPLILLDAIIVSLSANGGFHALSKMFPSLFPYSGSSGAEETTSSQ